MESDLRERIAAAIRSAPDRRVPTLRGIRREASEELATRSGTEALRVARQLLRTTIVPRWFINELVHRHPEAMSALDAGILRELGEGMSSWGEVDPFACYLSGVAWREGLLSDEEVTAWAASDDLWWRRAAVVSTVPLNLKSRGGEGDAPRTLTMCDRLKADREDMIVKAVSWALRALAVREPDAVREYLEISGDELAPRVRREVRNKLETGRKNPEA